MKDGRAAGVVIGLRKGAWTAEEDVLLRKCVLKFGEGNWHHVPFRAGLNRCRKSCRLRWLNYLKPNIKRGDFSPDEVDLMIRLHNLLGNRWSLIAGRLPGRTANDVKNYWNTHLKKKQTKITQDDDDEAAAAAAAGEGISKTCKCKEMMMKNTNTNAAAAAATTNNNTEKQTSSSCTSMIIKPRSFTLPKNYTHISLAGSGEGDDVNKKKNVTNNMPLVLKQAPPPLVPPKYLPHHHCNYNIHDAHHHHSYSCWWNTFSLLLDKDQGTAASAAARNDIHQPAAPEPEPEPEHITTTGIWTTPDHQLFLLHDQHQDQDHAGAVKDDEGQINDFSIDHMDIWNLFSTG